MLEIINKIVWSDFLLILLLFTGLIISFKLKFFQILKFPYILKNTVFSLFKNKSVIRDGKNGVSQFASFSTALAATMGTGNIIGVASAITIGGAGSVFWMWISAIIGMALVYAENYLGTVYTKFTKDKRISGTPAYLEFGAKKKSLAVIFCLFCCFASLGMGNMTQINSISQSMKFSFDIPPAYTGIIFSVIVFFIISGGIKRIGGFSKILIPVLSLAFIAVSVAVIINNHSDVPDVLKSIFKGAFGINAIGGGISGEIIKRSINTGLRRGIFSNEAGLGSSPLLHSGTTDADPHIQGLWAVSEVFIDTIICCTLTAFAILLSNADAFCTNGVLMVTTAFESVLGSFSGKFISISLILFAFATIISWYYCGECCIKYIFRKNAVFIYRIIFSACIIIGACSELETVWILSDIFNGLMAFPNLFGLIMLRNKVSFNCNNSKGKQQNE